MALSSTYILLSPCLQEKHSRLFLEQGAVKIVQRWRSVISSSDIPNSMTIVNRQPYFQRHWSSKSYSLRASPPQPHDLSPRKGTGHRTSVHQSKICGDLRRCCLERIGPQNRVLGAVEDRDGAKEVDTCG